MKATDFMLGDWVKTPVDVGKIQAMYAACLPGFQTVEVWHKRYEDGRRADDYICDAPDLQPIPLTPEILEKNGFKKGDFMEIENQHTWTLVLDTIHYVSLWTRNLYDNADEGWVFKAETSQVNGGLSLNAVHELQHALRLCGIEKEIEI